MSDARHPLADAERLAHELSALLAPQCERVMIAGSIRRGCRFVGDIELLYIPRCIEQQSDLFAVEQFDLAADYIEEWIVAGVLRKRLSSVGLPTWGAKNKLATHVATGIDIDLFATTHECWHNALVCRTGPKSSNVRIAEAAKAQGENWNVYGPGFTHATTGRVHICASEMDVFHHVGLPYLSPAIRS